MPIGPIGQQREQIAAKIRSLMPTQGTPLYTVTGDSYDDMRETFDPARINAVVLLSDGRNEDPANPDFNGLITNLRSGSEGQTSRPVRVFPIAYGEDADLPPSAGSPRPPTPPPTTPATPRRSTGSSPPSSATSDSGR